MKFLDSLFVYFLQMFENIKTQTENTSWEVIEASLFVMTAVAKNLLP